MLFPGLGSRNFPHWVSKMISHNQEAQGSPEDGSAFSARLARKLETPLQLELERHGLELMSLKVEPMADDDLLLSSWGAEIVLTLHVRTAGCVA